MAGLLEIFQAPVSKSFLLATVASLALEKSSDYSRSKRVLDIFMTHLRKLDNKSRGQIMGLLASSNALDREYIVNFLLASLKLMVNCSRADIAVLNGSGNEDAMLVEKASDDSIMHFKLHTMLRCQSAFWNPRYSDWSLPDI